jgi:two-component system, NarL family, invasion response regulator UvrY
MPRVLIADDHAVVRAGYKQFLETDASITEIGEAASGQEALDALNGRKWDLLLMDIHMPDRGGLDVLNQVTSGYPDVRVLIMSGLPEEQYACNVLRAGARGYLSKDGSPAEFMKAVRIILSGRRYLSPTLAESMATAMENQRDQNQPLHACLSAREFQVFLKLASGASVSEIAAGLSLSAKTVSTYRSRILEKMSFGANADMTSYAMRNGLMQ